MMKTLRDVNRVVSRAEEYVVCTLLMLVFCVIMVEVVCRYLLYIPTPWAEELARYAFICLAFIGGANAVWKWEHIDIDIADSVIKARARNPEKILRIIRKIALVACILFFLYFTALYYSFWKSIFNLSQISVSLGIPMSIPMGMGLLGLFLMLFHGVSRLILSEGDAL